MYIYYYMIECTIIHNGFSGRWWFFPFLANILQMSHESEAFLLELFVATDTNAIGGRNSINGAHFNQQSLDLF